MAATRGSYPHPVLDYSDDVASTFEVFNVTVTPTVEDVEVGFQVRMTDPDLQALIEAGRARFNFRWTCGSTITGGALDDARAVQMADSTRYTAWIDQRDVRRKVRVQVSVIATEEMVDYRLAAQHADYGTATFHVQPGDVLADAGYFEFAPDKLFDPLNPPVGSCFRFVPDTRLRKGVAVRFHHDQFVLVAFPESLLAEFHALAGRPDLQIGLVVLPALMETIAFIRSNDAVGDTGEDLSDRLWYEAIRGLVEGVGSFEDSPLTLAQRILANPIDATLSLSLQQVEDDS